MRRSSRGSRSTTSSARLAAAAGSGKPLQHGGEPHELERGQRLEQRLLLGDQPDAAGQREVAVGIAAEHAHGALRRARVSPQSIRSIVDLPAPFGPSSAVTPGPTWNDTSETATTSPNHFETCSTAISTSWGGGRCGDWRRRHRVTSIRR